MAQLKGGTTIAGYPALHSGNAVDLIKEHDGTGSGLDADLLDGNHASHFATATALENLRQEAVQTMDMVGTELRLKDGDGNIESTVNMRSELDKIYMNVTGGAINTTVNMPMIGKDHNDVITLPYVKGGEYVGPASATGYIKITLPIPFSSGSIGFTAMIYVGNGRSLNVEIRGGLGSGWVTNPTAFCIQNNETANYRNLSVAFSTENGKPVVAIGSTTTTWEYPRVAITNIYCEAPSVSLNQIASGWTVAIGTTIGTINHTIAAKSYVASSGNSNTLNHKGSNAESVVNSIVARDGNGDIAFKKKLKADNFTVEFNSSTESIDFKFK